MRFLTVKRLLVLPLLFLASSAIAQPPPAIPITAVAKDPYGNPAKNRTVYVKDIIFQNQAVGGTKVWEETFVVTTNEDGIYTIIIGKGTKLPAIPIADLTGIDWGNGPYFLNLKVAVAPSIPASWWVANDNYLDMGTSQMMSVAYAMFAGNASVTNVTTSLPPGLPNTFLTTDSLGNVGWTYPQSASVNITQISNNILTLTPSNLVAQGQDAIIEANTTTKITMDVPGAEVGDPIVVTPLGDYVNFNVYSAWVPEANKVAIRFSNFQRKRIIVSGNLYKIVLIK